jgi:hypothetical protein
MPGAKSDDRAQGRLASLVGPPNLRSERLSFLSPFKPVRLKPPKGKMKAGIPLFVEIEQDEVQKARYLSTYGLSWAPRALELYAKGHGESGISSVFKNLRTSTKLFLLCGMFIDHIGNL